MLLIDRRGLLAVGASLATDLLAGKAGAEDGLLDLSALKPSLPPKSVPEIHFLRADGTKHGLEEFRGRGIVLNLWATWCNPCVAELPSLDALSVVVASEDVAVMPLSSDRGGSAAVEKFYRAHGIDHLPILLDPYGAAAEALGVHGIPTTLVIGRDGLEHGRLQGAADWAGGGEAVIRLIG